MPPIDNVRCNVRCAICILTPILSWIPLHTSAAHAMNDEEWIQWNNNNNATTPFTSSWSRRVPCTHEFPCRARRIAVLLCIYLSVRRKNTYPIPISDRRDNGESLNKENRQWNRFDRYSCVIDHVQENHNIKIQNADGECEAEKWYVRVGNSMVLFHGAGTFDMQMNSVNVQSGACLQCIVIYGLWVLSSDS